MRWGFRSWLVLTSTLGCLAQANDSQALRIQPPKIALVGPGASQRFIVTAVDFEGRGHDTTRNCQFESSDSSVAIVDGAAVRALRPGSLTIHAMCDGLTVVAEVNVGEQTASTMQVDFARDLMSVFTTKGCNGSACHGSPAGQNGFKLSLFGADPSADYQMIASAHDGRRLDLDAPEKSLLLAKPTFEQAHGGGHLMTRESDEYRTLLSWIEQGAKLGSTGAQLSALEVYPSERIFAATAQRQRLVVVGRMSDGTTLDMTDEVHFSVADGAVVSLDASPGSPIAESKARGATTVMARGMGKTATTRFIVTGQDSPPPISTLEPTNFIDEFVFDRLRRVQIEPYPVSDDTTFVRRVFLDAIGVLPTPAEVAAFAESEAPNKRAKLIDSLLDREEYITHWLVKFEDWFRNSQYYSQGRTNGAFKRWLYEYIRDDRPYDEAVREMLTATGDTTVRPAGNFWHPAMDFMLKEFKVDKATPTITRLFLGKRIECAQCHNHPLENLTQDDFYGMAAFLARTQVKHGYGQYRRIWYDTRGGELEHPVTKQRVAPKFLEGAIAELPVGETRREVLAGWITGDQRDQLARATANRVWFEYFGRGIVEPFDDFRSTNPPSHPELLDRLGQYFEDSGFRFKALHRLVLNSKTYQLAAHSRERPGGADPLEEILFARYVPRRLPAETLLDSIVQVTGVNEDFSAYPDGTSAKQLVASIGGPYFLRTFGTPQRDVMEPRSAKPSLAQALHLMNGDSLRDKISADHNVLGQLIAAGASDSEIVADLYLRTYGRRPTAQQRSRIDGYVRHEVGAGRTRRRAFENVLWAILNSKEFLLNR